MLDDVSPTLARVALVFGDADSVAHLRDAVSDRVRIVYEASTADFDTACLAAAQPTVVLVNVDGSDWLETIQSRLDEVGVAVVFNDPEISGSLEGWARARWLRHLVAKLAGNGDFDPPRPRADASATAVDEASENTATADRASSGSERRLSPAEIDSLTADFEVVQDASAQAPGEERGVNTGAPQTSTGTEGRVEAKQSPDTIYEVAGNPLTSGSTAGAADPLASGLPASNPGAGDPSELDVDTEALSAMIDARLAQADGHESSEAPVWRVVEGDSSLSDVTMVDQQVHAVPIDSAADAPVSVPSLNEADSLKDLPALEEWELIDPEVRVVTTDPTREAASVSTLLDGFEGLELVPMETGAIAQKHDEPIERWMHDVSDRDKPNHGRTSESKGDHA